MAVLDSLRSSQKSFALVRGLWSRFKAADLGINAAAVAYNAFLALVPLTFMLLGVAAFVGGSASALGRLERTLGVLAPQQVVTFMVELAEDADVRIGGQQGWLIAGSVLFALYFGSRAVVALQKALAQVEDRSERRPAVQMRLMAVGLTVAGGVVLLLTSFLLVATGWVVEFLGEFWGLGGLDSVWRWARIPVAAVGLFAFLAAFYRWGPPVPLERSLLAAVVATTVAMLASLGFGSYLSLAPGLGATFGVLGAVAVALVWLYLGAFAILFGAVVAEVVGPARSPSDAVSP